MNKSRFLIGACMVLVTSQVHADAYDDIEKGRALLSSDPKAAVQAFTSAQIELPENVRLHYNLGVAQYKAGEYEAAEASFSASLDDEQLGLVSRYNLGNVAMKQQQFEDAIAYYDEVVQQNPQHENALFNLEVAKKELEKKKQQEKDQQQKDDKEGKDKDKDQQKKDEQKDGKEGEKKDQKKDQQQKDSSKKEKKDDSDTQKKEGEKKDSKDSDESKKEDTQEGSKKDESTEGGEEKPASAQEGSMSKEDLQKLMQQAKEREKKTRRKLYLQVPGNVDGYSIEKDW